MRVREILGLIGCLFIESLASAGSSQEVTQEYAARTIDWIEGKIYKERIRSVQKGAASVSGVGLMGAVSGLSISGQEAASTRTTTVKTDTYVNGAGYTTSSETGSKSLTPYTDAWHLYDSFTTSTTQHYNLLSMLGGSVTSMLETGGVMGASAFTVYVLFKLGKEAADRKACNYACGFDRLERSIKNARVMDEKEEKQEQRIEKNKSLTEIAAGQLTNAIKLFKESSENKNEKLKEDAIRCIHKKNDGFIFQKPGAEIEYILSLFANSSDYNIYLASQTAGRCLMKCPVDLSWKFMCKMIRELADQESVLRLGQILSASHHNLVSFNTVKNTNLARFLHHTRGGYSERQKYGTGTENLCSEGERTSAEDPQPLSDKIQILIDFQLALENHAKLKEEKALVAEYDKSLCDDCDSQEGEPKDDLETLHIQCQAEIKTLQETQNHAAKKASSLFFGALRQHHYEKKKKRYEACIELSAR